MTKEYVYLWCLSVGLTGAMMETIVGFLQENDLVFSPPKQELRPSTCSGCLVGG